MSAGRRRASDGGGGRFSRLSSVDLMYLRVESHAWPCHFGGLAVVEAGPLLDASGQLRLEEMRDRLDRRLARVPELRRRVYLPGPLRGRPVWVDDQRFAIEHHVHEAAVAAPGGDAELLEAAAGIYGRPLDRRHPLWELWFLTALADGRVGVLLKLHHAIADGMAAVTIMGSLFDLEPDAPEPAPPPWTPEPIPGSWSLVADGLRHKVRTLGRVGSIMAHPRRLVGGARVFALVVRRSLGAKGAPRTSLNRAVRAGRRIGFLRLDLATMKEQAHAHGGKLNDVVLDLWAGGLRELLVSRGESVGVEVVTSQAVSLRASTGPGSIDNQTGTIVLPLPVWEADARRRLDRIVGRTRQIKPRQRPAAIMGALAGLSGRPLERYFTLHQRACNVMVTNVPGPSGPVYVFGTRVLAILPIIQLVGNIGLTLCALSYAGQVFMVVTADATNFHDLDVLMAGMERAWHALVGDRVLGLSKEDIPTTAGHRLDG